MDSEKDGGTVDRCQRKGNDRVKKKYCINGECMKYTTQLVSVEKKTVSVWPLVVHFFDCKHTCTHQHSFKSP